jgi:hypothetical protein
MAHVRVRTTSRGRRYVARYQEDDVIPTRVIDELMGHAATRRPSWSSARPPAEDAG